MDVPGEPRSLAEMEFVAGLEPCGRCGDHRAPVVRVDRAGEVWTVRGRCAGCGAEREHVFHCARDLRAASHPPLELGGPEPSRVLAPGMLADEIDRLVAVVAGEPAAHLAELDRLRTALRELAKLGVDTDGEQARWDAIAAAVGRRAPLGAEAIAAHGAWLARGKAGEGRLAIVIGEASGLVADGADLAACRLEAVRLGRASLRGARLEDAELIDVDLRGARLGAATLTGARLRGCWLDAADLEAASFDRARLDRCVLDGASLARTRWRAAAVHATSLRATRLAHAQLDGARFVDCDFRDAQLGALAAGAVFERCDLRGASLAGSDLRGAHLVRCKLAGVYGAPASTDGWSVVFADFSAAGDGSAVGDGEDLLDELAD